MALQQDSKKETNFPSAFENQRNTTYEKKYSDLNAIGLCQLLPVAYLKIIRGGGKLLILEDLSLFTDFFLAMSYI